MTEPRLKAPLRDQLLDPVTQEAVNRVERKLFEELDRPELLASSWMRGPRLAWVGLPVLSAVLVFLVLWGRRPDLLLTEDGAELSVLQTDDGARVVRFADGSQILAQPRSRLVGVLSSAEEFVVALERGAVDVEVTPGGPRRWTIETGMGKVQVVGTAFSVRLAEGTLAVAVREGVVLVRSPHLDSAVARLEAGEMIEVVPSEDRRRAATGPANQGQGLREDQDFREDRDPDPQSAPLGLSQLPEEVLAPASPSSSGGKSSFEEEALDPGRAGKAEAEFQRLREAAELARSQGRPEQAARHYEALVRSFPGDPRLPFVLYGWGAAVSQTGDLAAAIGLFERALALGAARSLSEDLLLRVVRAKITLGDVSGARAYAARYGREFPSGRYRAVIELLVAGAGGRGTGQQDADGKGRVGSSP